MNTSMLHEKSDAVHFLRGPEEMTTATSSVVDGGGQEADSTITSTFSATERDDLERTTT